MPDEGPLASAYVTILPDMDRFVQELAADLEAATNSQHPTVTVDFDGDLTRLEEKAAEAQVIGDQFAEHTFTAKFDADLVGFTKRIMDDMRNAPVVRQFNEMANAIQPQITPQINTAEIGPGMLVAEAMAEGFARPIHIPVEIDEQGLSSSSLRDLLANARSTFAANAIRWGAANQGGFLSSPHAAEALNQLANVRSRSGAAGIAEKVGLTYQVSPEQASSAGGIEKAVAAGVRDGLGGAGGGRGGGGIGSLGLLAAGGWGGDSGGFLSSLFSPLRMLSTLFSAHFGSLGSLAGFGPEHLVATGAGLLGSATGAGIGGGLLGAAGLSTAAVGMGTDYAGIGQALGDIKQVYAAMGPLTQAQTQYNQAVKQFGAGSQQAQTALQAQTQAQQALNTAVTGFNPVAQKAVVQAAVMAGQLKTQFDNATGYAEKYGAEIIQDLEKVASAYIPTIGKFATENMQIIKAQIQPFLSWLKSPTGGLGDFTVLEQVFQRNLPTALDAMEQGFKLFANTMAQLAPLTGGFVKHLDDLFTRLNTPSGFEHFMHNVDTLIEMFHTWAAFIDILGRDLFQLFSYTAGLGTDIVKQLTEYLNRFHAFLTSAAGSSELKNLFNAHRAEVLRLIDSITQLGIAFFQVYFVAAPIMTKLTTLIIGTLDAMLQLVNHIPGGFGSAILGITILMGKMGVLNTMLGLKTGDLNILQRGFRNLGQSMAGLVFPAEEGARAFGAWKIALGGIALGAVAFGVYELIRHFGAIHGTMIAAAAALGVFGGALLLLKLRMATTFAAGALNLSGLVLIGATIYGTVKAVQYLADHFGTWGKVAAGFVAAIGAITTALIAFKTVSSGLGGISLLTGLFKGGGAKAISAQEQLAKIMLAERGGESVVGSAVGQGAGDVAAKTGQSLLKSIGNSTIANAIGVMVLDAKDKLGSLAGTIGDKFLSMQTRIGSALRAGASAAIDFAGTVTKQFARMIVAGAEWVAETTVIVAKTIAGWVAEAAAAVADAAVEVASFVAVAAAATAAFIVENLATLGLIAGIAALVAGIIYLATHWKQVWSDIKQWTSDAINFIKAHILEVAIFNPLLAGIIELAIHWKAVWNGIKTVIGDVVSFVRGHMVELGAALFIIAPELALVTAAIVLLATHWRQTWAIITDVVKVAVTLVETYVHLMIDQMKLGFDLIAAPVKIAMALIEGVIKGTMDVIVGVIKIGLDLLTGNWGAAWRALGTMVSQIWGDIKGTVGSIISTITGLGKQIIHIFADAGHWLIDAGKAIVDGLVNGIKNAAHIATDAVKDIGHGIVSAFKSVLSIFSPSQVFIQLGQAIPAGAAQGVTSGGKQAIDAVTSLGKSMTDAMGKSMSTVQITGKFKQIANEWGALGKALQSVSGFFGNFASAIKSSGQITDLGILSLHDSLMKLVQQAPAIVGQTHNIIAAFGGLTGGDMKGKLQGIDGVLKNLGGMFNMFSRAADSASRVTNLAVLSLHYTLSKLVTEAPAIAGAVHNIMASFQGLTGEKNLGKSFQGLDALFKNLGGVFNLMARTMASASKISDVGLLSLHDSLAKIIQQAPAIVGQISTVVASFKGLEQTKDIGKDMADIGKVFTNLGNLFQAFANIAQSSSSISVSSMQNIMKGLQTIEIFAPGIVGAIKNIEKEFSNLGKMNELETELGNLKKVFGDLGGVFTTMSTTATAAGGVTTKALSQIGTAIDGLVGNMSKLAGGVALGASAAVITISNMSTQIQGIFSTLVSKSKNIGSQLMQGLTNGINQGATGAETAAANAAKTINTTVASIHQVTSPSRVFHNIGLNLMQGLANGINQGLKTDALPAITSAANAMTKGFNPTIAANLGVRSTGTPPSLYGSGMPAMPNAQNGTTIHLQNTYQTTVQGDANQATLKKVQQMFVKHDNDLIQKIKAR